MGDFTTGDQSPFMAHVTRVGEILETGKEPLRSAFNKTALAKGLVFGALGPAGMIAELATSYAEKVIDEKSNRQRYLAGIEKLAEKEVPGFGHQQISIDDTPVRLAVDSSAILKKPDAKPWVYSSADPSDPRVQAALDTLARTTTDRLSQAEQQHKSDYATNQDARAAYAVEQKKYLDTLQFGDAAAKEKAVSPKAPAPPLPEDFALVQVLKIRETQLDNIKPDQLASEAAAPLKAPNDANTPEAPQQMIGGLDRMTSALSQPTDTQPSKKPAAAPPPKAPLNSTAPSL